MSGHPIATKLADPNYNRMLWLMSTKKVVGSVKKSWHSLGMMSSEQCRAARAWLNWTQQELARRAKVGLSTVGNLKKGSEKRSLTTAEAMQRALADAGN